MSRDFILNYAKGISNAPAYMVVYSTRDGAIVIHSCVILSGQKESVLIGKNYDDTERINVPDSDVLKAAMKYMAAGQGIKNNRFDSFFVEKAG
jgi:hypothetical protein